MKHETPYYDLWQTEKARREELEEELRQLRDTPDGFLSPIDLSPAETAYMRCLLDARPGIPVTHDQLMDAADSIAARGAYDDPAPRKVTHVIIFRLRKSLAQIGATIENVPWQGYRLPPESRKAWADACAAMVAQNTPPIARAK